MCVLEDPTCGVQGYLTYTVILSSSHHCLAVTYCFLRVLGFACAKLESHDSSLSPVLSFMELGLRSWIHGFPFVVGVSPALGFDGSRFERGSALQGHM